jgi:thiol-disulfide isomerase/thioredoxin
MLAPEFPSHLDWLNTDRKYKLVDFRGKFVLLDFWTYGCINCMHVIPDLKRLEEKYPEMVVIGVHSAKFANERESENIEKAILRYDITHPMIVDSQFKVWDSYGIRAWPSFILIAPDGEMLGKTSGEGIFERLDPVMPKLISEYDSRGVLNHSRIAFATLQDTDKSPQGFLAFPGKICADGEGKRLFVSDSSHHRVLVLSPEGGILDVIGSGFAGSKDGSFYEASFSWPQGLVLDGEHLYVADTDNNLIRRADMERKMVETVAGMVVRDKPLPLKPEAGAPGKVRGSDVHLSSPWDQAVLGDWIYIAMAGTHQIWRLNRMTLKAEPYAGSGMEGIMDGPAAQASLAQPSGITTDGRVLYFADSEASALRNIKDDVVITMMGTGLFDFGDVDGEFSQAKLQHPLGVLYHEGALYIADTYNHKIKRADLSSRSIITVAGTGNAGHKDGPALFAEFREPGGLSMMGGKIYVADTNNHQIRIYDPAASTVATLEIGGVGKKGSATKGCELCGVRVADTGIFADRLWKKQRS